MSSVADPHEQAYLDAKRQAERQYAQDLAAVVHLRGGDKVREAARKAAGEKLREAYDAAWLRYVAAGEQEYPVRVPLGHGNSGPGGAL